MIKNYLKIAWRNLVKNRFSSLINIGGLAVGMAVAMMIGLWIWDELSFDKNFKNYGRITEVRQNNVMNGEVHTGNSVPWPMGDALRKEFGSDFKYVTMATYNNGHILSYSNKKLNVNGTYFEPSALQMLSFKMLKGDNNSLNDPSAIMLSESTAKSYFGNADPVDQLMKVDNNQVVKVTGVYADLPQNSSFAGVNFVAPWEQFSNANGLKKQTDTWRCNCYFTYAQLADHADINKVSASIKDIKQDKVNKIELKQKNQVFLNPMKNWHLYSDFKNGVVAGGRIQYVQLFGIIGIFVLLLASINFMNLSTARSEKRAKEVGIRKAIGSMRRQLIYQFLSESLLVALAAFVLSIILIWLALPFFNDIAGKKISILWDNPLFWLAGFVFSLLTGLISGSYPALYLSSFQPVKVLKGTFKAGRFAAVPRKILVVLQFTVSVTLIIGTIVVFLQIQFAKNRPVGYSRQGLITLPMVTGDIHKQFAAFKDELEKSGTVVSISESGSPTTGDYSSNSGFDWRGKDPGQAVEFPNIDISPDYGKTVNWQVVAGRDLSAAYLTDSTAFIINETAAKFMGLKNPVGETLKWDGVPFHIIGVVKDMVSESPYFPVRPTLFHLLKGGGDFVIVRINPKTSASEALAKIEKAYKTYNPAQPFEYHFVDDDYAQKFGDEERISKLSSCFAGLAIFISCLGLFGMASFMAEQRTKEIGVRKVLGATVVGLWGLLSKDFVRLVMLSLLLAIPVAWYFMNGWLQHYTYRTDISWWVFAATAAGVIAITLLTVSYQSIKAAMANPVKSLKTE
jgi:putative ABC transport system permease protein